MAPEDLYQVLIRHVKRYHSAKESILEKIRTIIEKQNKDIF